MAKPFRPISFSARAQPWVQAARPLAFPMILLPLLLGELFALHAHGQFSLVMFVYLLLFGGLYQVYLLYSNDFADEAIDRSNTQYWLSGGSRVIPEGKLRGEDLMVGARAALTALMALALMVAFIENRPWLVMGALAAALLSWAYSQRPVQLSYRGQGELAQGLVCGVVLPLMGFYGQHGSVQLFPWSALLTLFVLFYAGNIITALPDYRSDKAGGKRSFPVRHGEHAARVSAVALLALAYANMVFVPGFASWVSIALVAVPAGLILVGVLSSGLLHRADAANFSACKAFVGWLSLSQAWLLCSWAGVLLFGAAL